MECNSKGYAPFYIMDSDAVLACFELAQRLISDSKYIEIQYIVDTNL